MKKIITTLLILMMVFPIAALDVISMNDGELYIGEILKMDVNDKVDIMTQDGDLVKLLYKDINSIKKVESENSGTTVIVNNENTNQNNNTIGANIVISNNDIRYIPKINKNFWAGIKYVPPKAIIDGIEYNIETDLNPTEVLDFISVVKTKQQVVDSQLENSIIDFEKGFINTRIMFWGGVGVATAGILLATLAENDDQIGFTIGMSTAVGGLISMLGGAAIGSLMQKDVKDIIIGYNSIY